MTLRDYQLAAVEAADAAIASSLRLLIQAPTGAGKTHVISEIARRHARRVPITVVAHRAEILDQIVGRLSDFGVLGRRTKTRQRPARVAVTSPGSIRHFDASTKRGGIVIVDEAHHATASTYRALIDRISPDAVIGVTATPCRMSGEPLREVFDRLHVGPSVPHLIGRGVLVEPEIYAPPPGAVAALLEGVKSRGGDYQRSQLSDRVVGLAGRTVAMYQQLAEGTQAVVFCVTVAHAQRVADQFNAAGISAMVITGKQGKREREQVVDSYRVGWVRVLCSVDVVSEGFDLPAIETAILARPTQSLALYLQQVGRALRSAPGKHGAVVIDQAGNVHRHGTPDALRRWSLDRAPVIVDDDRPKRKVRELEPRAALGVTVEEVDAALVRIRARESIARAKPPKHEQQGAELFLRVSTDPAYPDARCEAALRWAREEHRRGWGRYVAPDDLATAVLSAVTRAGHKRGSALHVYAHAVDAQRVSHLYPMTRALGYKRGAAKHWFDRHLAAEGTA